MPIPHRTAVCRLALIVSLPLTCVVTVAPPAWPAASVCSTSAAVPTEHTLQETAASVACEINQERVQRQLTELRADRTLALAAERHARDMVRRGFFSHVTPGGRGMTARVRAAGYLEGASTWWLAETLAWGTGRRSSPAAVVAAWMHSGSHRRVLVNERYREVGIGLDLGTPFAPTADGAATFAAELGFVQR